jgi:NAD(P)-dependent dehydrogenase (short-subunit alcohol dehydrogenase family)
MKNKNVLITGAGRGIGLALTKEFTQNGYSVFATYRSEISAAELLKLAKEKPTIKLIQIDVASDEGVKPLSAALKKSATTIDILINNSGVIGDKSHSILEQSFDSMMQVFNINTLGAMRVIKSVLPFMEKGSTIAQITSLMGSITDNGSGGYYDYRVSKAALNMMNMCLAKELPQMTCLVLHPGWVQTDMGGAGAKVSVDDCARGLFRVITTPSLRKSGEFLDYQGEHLPW